MEPGWGWEKCVKPLVKTDSCQAPHTQYLISGRIKVVIDDGAEEEFGLGDAAVIPPGHNTWVVGNESVVRIDFTGLKEYAKSESELTKVTNFIFLKFNGFVIINSVTLTSGKHLLDISFT